MSLNCQSLTGLFRRFLWLTVDGETAALRRNLMNSAPPSSDNLALLADGPDGHLGTREGPGCGAELGPGPLPATSGGEDKSGAGTPNKFCHCV